MKKNFSLKLSTTQIIMLSFLVVILMGSVLLALPVSSANGEAIPKVFHLERYKENTDVALLNGSMII